MHLNFWQHTLEVLAVRSLLLVENSKFVRIHLASVSRRSVCVNPKYLRNLGYHVVATGGTMTYMAIGSNLRGWPGGPPQIRQNQG
jgi:hypothetical protein